MLQRCHAGVVGVLAWLSAGPAGAATPDAGSLTASPFNIRAWDTDDGLPQNSVTTIVQTHDGYLWLGTLNGLVRFDGSRFTIFDESNTPRLPSSRIVSLFEDPIGTLWIGTETGGVAYLNDGEVTSTGLGQGASESRLTAACADSAGGVWLNTADGAVWQYRAGRFTPFLFGHDRPSALRSLVATTDGELWIGTDTRLARIGAAGGAALELPVLQEASVGRLDCLAPRRPGGFWCLADGRVQWWKGGRLERDFGPYPWAPATRVMAAAEDLSGNLVVGTASSGLFWFGPAGAVSRLTTREGLSHNTVISLCADREGNLWAGTQGGGLNRIKSQVFEVLEGTRGQSVLSVCEDAAGGLWAGTDGDGLFHWRPDTSERFDGGEGLINPQVLSVLAQVVAPARTGLLADSLVEFGGYDTFVTNVWAGTRASGLFELRGRVFQPAIGADGLHAVVAALHRDRQGRIWCGTPGGLGLRTEPGWRLFTTTEGLSANEVRALADDPEGSLWIGTVGGGLSRLRDGQFTHFRKSDGLPSDDLSSLLVDDEGVLWVGTFGSGLARFQQGRWTRFTQRDGLPSNSIGAMLDDGEGSLWIGSNAGLARVPRAAFDEFAAGRAPRIACRVYGRADGLPTREFPLGSQPAAWRGAEGRLWFASVRGLIAVSPNRLRPNLIPPPVLIEDVRVDGEVQGTNALQRAFPQPLVIPPGRERLEIQFTSLNLGAPDRARFRYRLTPHEGSWVEAGGDRVARYPKLPPGTYRFHVIASNEDGVWNDTGATLAVVVLTPLWRQPWFVAGVATVLLALIAAVVRYLSTQKLQRQLLDLKREEALEKERARIAQDLHDQLGANLTQVAMLGELVEVDKDLPDEVATHAHQITQTARETTRTLDEIVWAVNPSNDTLEGLVTYLCKHTQEYLAVAGIRYRLAVPSELPAANIPPDVRHNVFLAAKEAVTNIVRHSGAASAWLRLHLGPATFTLEIEDDGKGLGELDEKAARNRNGLRGMRKRLTDIGGQFEIVPATPKGTVIRLTAPWRTGGRAN